MGWPKFVECLFDHLRSKLRSLARFLRLFCFEPPRSLHDSLSKLSSWVCCHSLRWDPSQNPRHPKSYPLGMFQALLSIVSRPAAYWQDQALPTLHLFFRRAETWLCVFLFLGRSRRFWLAWIAPEVDLLLCQLSPLRTWWSVRNPLPCVVLILAPQSWV